MSTRKQAILINEATELLLEKIDSFVPLNYLSDDEYSVLQSKVKEILQTLCEDYSSEEVEKYLPQHSYFD